MRNFRLLIEYEGTHYAGWQHQKNANTIQETLSRALQKVLQKTVKVYGSGRTDAGVHALGQVANFKTVTKIPAKQLLRAINYYLPYDIVVKDVTEVNESFHAQFSAKSKIYQYTVYNDWIRPSIRRNFCFICGFELDIKKMKEAAKYLLGTHNFTSFTTKAIGRSNRIRTIKSLDIHKDGSYIYFTIEADGFLYNMVRAIVGTLLEVGRGKRTPESMKDILEAKDRNMAGATVPGKGLCLMEVKY